MIGSISSPRTSTHAIANCGPSTRGGAASGTLGTLDSERA
jgi:hypothetical protein